MRILTSDEVRHAESVAMQRPDTSALVLMQRAGYAVARFCISNFKFRSVCVVCGKGNNGGDGLVAAEALRDAGASISIIILAEDIKSLSPDAAAFCERLRAQPLWVAHDADFETEAVQEALAADLIIDAIVGTGFKPPLRGLAKTAVEAINHAAAIVVAVDLPTGVDADLRSSIQREDPLMVFSHGIVTFIAPKPAHIFGELTSGPIAVSELGVQPVLVSYATELSVVTAQEVGTSFPPRLGPAHKGEFGHVLVVGGSSGKAGAAALAGIAALRSGAGLVTVACPKSIQATVAGFAPELMTEALAETGAGAIAMQAADKVTALLHGKDVVVLGPGLSRDEETAKFARWLVAHCSLPLVLDADGLNAFEGHYNELQHQPSRYRVLTPHPGEAARLLHSSTADIQNDRMEVAHRLAKETGCCVVLKGSGTIIAGASGETWLNLSGNPALAKGGSGDVLSGIIAAALARKLATDETKAESENQQPESFAAKASAFLKDVRVAAAVHLHGLAGDMARDGLHEHTVLATDVPGHLSEAFHDCELQSDQGLFYLQK